MSGRGIGRAAAVGPLEAPPGLAAVGWDLPSAAPAQGANYPGLARAFVEPRLPVGPSRSRGPLLLRRQSVTTEISWRDPRDVDFLDENLGRVEIERALPVRVCQSLLFVASRPVHHETDGFQRDLNLAADSAFACSSQAGNRHRDDIAGHGRTPRSSAARTPSRFASSSFGASV